MSNLAIQYVSPDRLRPYPGNARMHSRKQLKLIADSIKRFGFTNPILVTDDFEVVAGHGRLQVIGHAARPRRGTQFAVRSR
jgi:ParB-like chromosome segregation protein Spo0J